MAASQVISLLIVCCVIAVLWIVCIIFGPPALGAPPRRKRAGHRAKK